MMRGTHFYDFSSFRLDALECLLLRDGTIVRLTPKAFDLLLILVQNTGHVLAKNELMKAVWHDSFVEESSVARTISTIRRALDESKGHYHYIETVPRRGYRFVGTVREVADDSQRPSSGVSSKAATISIAVLPFKPLSVAECDADLGLRLADALITRLSTHRKIIVRPTSAIRKYTKLVKGSIVAGRELKVDNVLEGSIQRSAERIRLTVQLISASDGLPLWASQFDAPFTDIFEVEDSVSTTMASALIAQLIEMELYPAASS
jgi:DNA-binding winged helix-turn-helix (wHTH) protein